MPKYKIKSYQEEFLEAQEKVGTEATKDWQAFGQTPATQLKQIYSQEGFDPNTKLYAFEGDKLVGFLTSSIIPESEDGIKRANLEFPIVLKGHEGCCELLFNKAIDYLKSKGLYATFHPTHLKIHHRLNNDEYKYLKDNNLI